MNGHVSFIKRQLLIAGVAWLILGFITPSTLSAQTGAANQVSSGPPQTELVKLYVAVLDKDSNFISKLNYFDFEVTCDKVPQNISYFSGKDDPLGIVFLMDVSASMREGGGYKKILPYLMQFIEQSHPQNEYTIMGFNNQVGVNLPWTRGREEAAKHLSEICSLPLKGNTALYEAIRLGINQVNGRSSPRGAIILVSDGMDTISAVKMSEVQNALWQNKVPLYTLLFNQNFSTLGGWTGPVNSDLEVHQFLSRLTLMTGGTMLLPRSLKELELGITHLAQELRKQYVIGFQPSCNHQGTKPHQVRVRISDKSTLAANRKSTQIRHREEYK